ncbi:hypothetical protein QAD02_001244 [Eretmocerus hayati]|uniref:Uncharacterized protein n=1 Tax=Eretmocerus hayati TaxID=131215 RepID=A0ACC2NFK7_9HYME|nr:hypothetical protein QAD02_001244 [Eretmocerus hayati]
MSSKDKKSGEGDSVTKSQAVPPWFNFVNAGASGMTATCFVHPMDVLKNRMQMTKGNPSIREVIGDIRAMGGLANFYRGLSAGLLRQATYTTARLGIYNQLQDMYREHRSGKKPSFSERSLMAMFAGSFGAFLGTPADVALVRMSSDGRLPPEKRRNYKNVFNALTRIMKEEGIKDLWRGSVPTMGRAAVVNVSQLATYSQTKDIFVSKLNMEEGVALHFSASMVSGLITVFNSMPFDIAKTRIQNLDTRGKRPGMFGMIGEIAMNEGPRALWKGFWPMYARVGPHTVITFIVNEKFSEMYRHFFMQ